MLSHSLNCINHFLHGTGQNVAGEGTITVFFAACNTAGTRTEIERVLNGRSPGLRGTCKQKYLHMQGTPRCRYLMCPASTRKQLSHMIAAGSRGAITILWDGGFFCGCSDLSILNDSVLLERCIQECKTRVLLEYDPHAVVVSSSA